MANILLLESSREDFDLTEEQVTRIARFVDDLKELVKSDGQRGQSAVVTDAVLSADFLSELSREQQDKLDWVCNRKLAAIIGASRVVSLANEQHSLGLSNREMALIADAESQAKDELNTSMTDAVQDVTGRLLEPLTDEQRRTLEASRLTEDYLCYPEVMVLLLDPEMRVSVPKSWMDEWGYSTTFLFPLDELPVMDQVDLGNLYSVWSLVTTIHSASRFEELLLLTENQKSDFEALGESLREKHSELMKNERRIDRLVAADELGEWAQEMLEQFLLPHQVDLLEQVAMERAIRKRGILFELCEGYLSDTLEITAEQKQEIREIGLACYSELKDETIRLENAFYDKIRSSLDAQSRPSFDEIFGRESATPTTASQIGVLSLHKQ